MLKEIRSEGKILGIIMPSSYHTDGINFLTPPEFSQQLALMHHPPGRIISPHIHVPVSREVVFTQEVLVIRKGKIRVDFYSHSREYLESHILNAGDVILLASGGHGFEVLEELEMIEIKQGPYSGETDKIRFLGITKNVEP